MRDGRLIAEGPPAEIVNPALVRRVFDLDRHVLRTTVPAPGTQEQLDEVISQIASAPLDRTRPLWEISVVEGLESGSIGFVAKMHHCMADGVMAAELLTNVFDLDPARLYGFDLPLRTPANLQKNPVWEYKAGVLELKKAAR